MQKRIAAAAGYYDIKFRIDKAYAKVNVRWTELTGYSRADGKFQGERPLGQTSVAGAEAGGRRRAAQRPHQTRTAQARRLPDRDRRRNRAARRSVIDERDYWFDGKTFEEL